MNFIPTISFSIFDIIPKAREIGLKLQGIIEDGEVIINTDFNRISIIINVYRAKNRHFFFSGSIIITINMPEINNIKYKRKSYERDREEKQDFQNIIKAIGIGVAAVGAVVLTKMLCAGIGGLAAGPVGVVVGLAVWKR